MRIDKYGRTVTTHLVYMSVQEKEILKAAARAEGRSLTSYITSKALAAAAKYAKHLKYDPQMRE